MGSTEGKPVESKINSRQTSREWSDWLTVVANFHLNTLPSRKFEDRRLYLTTTIFGKSFRTLIDTGAMLTFVSDDVAFHLQLNGVIPEPTKMKIHLADNRRVKAQSTYTFPCKIGEQPKVLRATHIPGLSSSIILGMDYIHELSLIKLDLSALQGNTKDAEITPEVAAVTDLTQHQEQTLKEFLDRELPLFNDTKGPTPLVEHTIKLKTSEPLKQRYYPRNPAMQDIMMTEVSEMLRDDIIEPSSSPWSSPVVLIKKPSGKYRFCIDFRRVNEASVKDAYPLPFISGVLNKLREANYITTLDLKNGYWQIPLQQDSRPVTAFTVPGMGLYQFKVMPFGLHSAPATFQRLLDTIIGPDLESKAIAYLDDIVILGKTFEEHINLLEEVFKRLRQAGLKLNPEKCQFGRTELRYLGHIIDRDGIHTDPEKIRCMQEFPEPTNVKTLRSFLGLVSWYRRFIRDFAKISEPLTSLLRRNARWEWNQDRQTAFDTLKSKLSTAPVLACPDFTQEFTLQVDASDFGLGAALTQKKEGKEVAIAFASRLLSDQERKYSVTEKECLALVWGIKTFRPYLEGYHFKAITDHQALRWLRTIKEPSGRLGRWILEIQQYDFEICYRKGINHSLADALSRIPNTDKKKIECDNSLDTVTLHEPEARLRSWYEVMLDRVKDNPRKYSNYVIHSGKLYRRNSKTGNKKPCHELSLCVPETHRERVLKENHDEPTAGHMGVRKTLHRIRQRYYWPGWKKDVCQYVRACDNCQRQKPEQKLPMGQMPLRVPKGPWYTVVADLIGPFPRSTRGYRSVLVIQDTFTKWIELAPVRAATAKEVKEKFNELIMLRYGSPSIILTDNGTQFTSDLFKNMAIDWDITHRFTAPYSPQSNPTERSNRVLKTMIRQFIQENHRHWDKYLSEFRLAINTAVQESTGYTPALLNFGRELRLPKALHHDVEEEIDEKPPENPHDRLRILKVLRQKVQKSLTNASTRQAKYYNLRRRPNSMKIGQQVLCRTHHLSDAAKGFAAKLAPKFEGPYTILRTEGANIFILGSDKGHTVRAHVKDLKPYLV